ncbi:uncharacterized protein LOC100266146 isoform X4 [Vitis vinifera]|uniref:uncharacterized protein LOC100266146 isoform X4 n=1 Tax=Vitis vinifera TaxID=29760 RepID=UPI002882FE9B|nr:uncharacterized protein LOC100266146 isoform X4 [Vitis vinifera]
MGSLNLCCHRALPNARLLPCSSALNNIITIKPHLLSSSSSSSIFHHHRHFCNSPTAVASTAKQLTSPELVALEYADLNLNYDNVSQIPAPVPNWCQVFKDSTLPLMVDIGSGSGRFLMWLAKRNPDSQNYLGLEIRQKLAKRAEFWVKELSLHNIHFMFANATISFKELVSAYPGPLMLVSLLCPDPHFKKRHHKRRVVQKPLVDSIVKNLMPGGQVFIQSDVLEVAVDMRDRFDAESDLLQHIDTIDPSMQCDEEGWLVKNPMGIRTEREIHAEFEGAKIYRRLYQKLI